ncbi:MAG: VWA domain-containing protein, partial [Phycisphaerae bacterium]|nr:VWA domain-containing protein [Phycisphaerae bacterium]
MRARGVGFAVAVVFVLTLLPIHRALGGSALEYKCSTAGTLSVCADMAKYLPDSWAYVSGNGYAPDSALTIRVTRPDGSMVSGDGTGAAWPTAYDTVVTDAEGHFDYFYFVNGTAGTYVADVMDGGSVVSACSFACFAGSKPKVDDGASTTTTVLSMVTLEWNDPASAPTQMRVANDATPEDGCSDLGGGSYTAWQPVTDSNGTNSMDFAWTLDAGPEGQRSVCVEAAKGALDVPIDSAVDEDQILLAVENPPLGDACGLDVVLVIDVSGSVNSTQLAQSKAAFVGFVNALLPSTPTQFAVVEFSTTANVLLGFSSSPATVIAAINSAGGGGSTNWDDALYDARLLFPNRLDKPDLIIFSSDGNPNYRGGHASHGSPTSVSPATALSFAVTEADAAKTAGIRIIALGIGSGVNIANLQAISSPDAVITSGFDTLADDLADLAIQICGGTITVNKLIDADGNLATTGDQTPAMGWTFSTNVDAPDFSTPASGMTDGSGQINFDIDLGDDLSAVVDVIETPQAGYALLSASCTVSGTPSGLAVNDITVSPLDVITCTFINAALCGNGTVDVGEDCDDGNTVDGDCCSSTCTFEIAGTACGNQTPEGACDLADVCDGAGMCVSNRVPSGTECRAAAGDCDVPEFCDGVAADCPSDALEPNTTECRASAGVCDPAEFCTGSSADCPADVLEPGSTECRASAGECDQAEFCTGSSADCPADGFEPNTTECRASAGVCDSAEFCTGTSASCPSDVFEPDTIECRSSTGVCDPAEFCTGSSADCPADVLEPGTTECRASAGDCDPAEFCTGSSADCPADVLEPGTTECRASAGACDPPEFCTGSSADCPADVFEPGSTECRPAAGVCDVAEFCTGSDADCPADAFLPDTTECNASTGDCDPAEYCTGSSADCPADEIAPFGTVCRVVAGPCDIEELCD